MTLEGVGDGGSLLDKKVKFTASPSGREAIMQEVNFQRLSETNSIKEVRGGPTGNFQGIGNFFRNSQDEMVALMKLRF